MKIFLGVFIVVLALVIGIAPMFTDCLANDRTLTTADGRSVPMKCHWTAIAEIGVAAPLALVGLVNFSSKRKETLRTLGIFGVVLGALAILFPTVLIGVCANPAMPCNMIMKPLLIAAGILAIGASLLVLFTSRKITETVA
jgi:hypothetical protein